MTSLTFLYQLYLLVFGKTAVKLVLGKAHNTAFNGKHHHADTGLDLQLFTQYFYVFFKCPGFHAHLLGDFFYPVVRSQVLNVFDFLIGKFEQWYIVRLILEMFHKSS